MQIEYLEQTDIDKRYKALAYSESIPTGTLLAFMFNSTVVIEKLLVTDSYRHIGIGSRMLELLESWSIANKANRIITPIPICEATSPLDIYGNYLFFKSKGYKTPLGVFAQKNLLANQAK